MESLKIVQTKLEVPKNQYNSFGGYSYRSCEDILKSVKPLLEETNSTILLADEIVQIGQRYYIKATATFKNGEGTISVSAYAREPESKKGMDASQITGAASSYARKYALNGLLCIDDNKDADARPPEDISHKNNETAKKVNTTKASQKQLKFIGELAKETGFTRDKLIEYCGREPEKLTKRYATELIEDLLKMRDNQKVDPVDQQAEELKKEFSS